MKHDSLKRGSQFTGAIVFKNLSLSNTQSLSLSRILSLSLSLSLGKKWIRPFKGGDDSYGLGRFTKDPEQSQDPRSKLLNTGFYHSSLFKASKSLVLSYFISI